MRDRDEIDRRLNDIADLNIGWDGYSAGAFGRATIAAARAVAHSLAAAGHHISITPTSTETVAIEWVQGGYECIADVDGDEDDN